MGGGGAEQSKSPTPMHAKATTPKRTRKLKFVFTTIEPGLSKALITMVFVIFGWY